VPILPIAKIIELVNDIENGGINRNPFFYIESYRANQQITDQEYKQGDNNYP